MIKTVQIAHNVVVAKIMTDDKTVKDIVSETLSYMVEGAAFMGGGWNGRSSFFKRLTSTFPAGFVHLVQAQLEQKGYRVQRVCHQAPAPLGVENPIVDDHGNDDPRYDFQLQALRQVEKHGRGIVQVATGGGKSKIAKLILARYRRMALFLTTRGVLLYQMKDQLDDISMNNGVIGDGQFNPTKGVNLGMVQTIAAIVKEPSLENEVKSLIEARAKTREKALKAGVKALTLTDAQIGTAAQKVFDRKTLERNRMIKILEMIEVVIGEEAQEASGESYYQILQHCKKAFVRVALTATPFMREDAEDNMRLMAAFGPVLIKVTEKMLIDRGILAEPHFLYRKFKPHPKLYRSTAWQKAYSFGIMECEDRNKDIIDFSKKAKLYKLPTLVLVQRKWHGDLLAGMMRDQGLKARFIKGADDNDERKRALKELSSGELDVVIGTTVLDVGVDVPAIGLVILAGGGKAEVALRQRIGRGLRAKKSMPNHAFVMDFVDDKNAFLIDHANQRRGIVEATPGFVERIVDGQDFDWSLFESHRLAA